MQGASKFDSQWFSHDRSVAHSVKCYNERPDPLRSVTPYALLILSIGAYESVCAQYQQNQVLTTIELEKTIVSATRIEQALEKIPAAIGVVDKEDLQLGAQQLGLDESLVKVPGLFMQNRYNFAQDLRISIRGFGARANFGIRGVKIFVDGVPQTLPDGQGSVDTIDLGSAERIEVIRGPISSLYGNASGGAILVTTESGPEIPFLESRLSFGEFDYQKYQLKTGGQTDEFNYLLNLSHLDYGGFREHSETENTQLNSKFGWDIDASSELTATINVIDSPIANDPGALTKEQAKNDPRRARALNEAFNAGEKLEQQRIGLVYRKAFGSTHEITARNYYAWRDFENKLPFVDGGSVNLDRFFIGGGVMYSYTGSLAGKKNRLIAGVDVDRQDDDRKRFDNNMGSPGDLSFDQTETVTGTGIYVQNEFHILEDLALTLGLRYDRLRFEVDDRLLSDGDDSGSRTLDERSPKAGLRYTVAPAVNLYGNVSTSFETPTTTEFANPSGAGGFNPDLEPQRSTNYEIGVKGNLTNGLYFYDIALFTIDVQDELIPFEIQGMPGRDFYENAGKSTRNGLEMLLSAAPLQGLEVSLAYTYSDFTFDKFTDDNGNVYDGNQIPGIPDHLIHGEIAYHHDTGIYGIVDTLYVDDFYVDNANSEENDAYAVANLRLGYLGYSGRWEFSPFFGINNIFNERYNSNVRLNAFGGRYFEPAPERNVFGGFTLGYTFGG